MQQSPHRPDADLDKQLIVLVHGLASATVLMKPLAWRLRHYGYQAKTWGYFSIGHSIERHGEHLADYLRRLDASDSIERLHLVTHSMGCIVARYALQRFVPRKTDRMVMLAPPNKGSHVASFLSRYLGGFCRPLEQLRDTEGSFVRELRGVQQLKVGIIAAAHDYMVPLSSTQVEWQADHTVISALHTGLLFRRETARQVRSFLQLGRFERSDASGLDRNERLQQTTTN